MTKAPLSVFERAYRYLSGIPGAVSGDGGHNRTFQVACVLVHGFALPEQDALALLSEYNDRCSPRWAEHELVHKIRSAAQANHTKPRGHLLGRNDPNWTYRDYRQAASASPKPKIDPTTAVENYLKGFACDEADLWDASPIRPCEDWTKDGALLVSMLYNLGELVNVVSNYLPGKDNKARPADTGATDTRENLIQRLTAGEFDSEAGAWLRMNPLDGRGVADCNVTAYRFALIECDAVPLALQLSLLAKLPLTVSAILSSGGRSVHAWVKVDAAGPDEYRALVGKLFALLARFGVDGKNRNPSRLSRLPGVRRSIGADGDGQQRLLYLNPDPVQEAILCR